jgi:hypothetical protein
MLFYILYLFLWHYRYLIRRKLTAPNGSISRNIKFGAIEIQGGGKIDIESDVDGLFISCSSLWIRSGGLITADRLTLDAQKITIEQSGIIDLSFKVTKTVTSS